MSHELVGGTGDPWAPFLLVGAEDAFNSFECLDVQVGDVGFAISSVCCAARELEPDFVIVVEHHLVLPESTGSVEHADDTFLGLHAAAGTAPGLGIAVPVVSPPRGGWAHLVIGGSGGLGDSVVSQDGTRTSRVSLCRFEGTFARAPVGIKLMRIVIVIVIIIIISVNGFGGVRNHMLLHCLLYFLVRSDFSEPLLVNGFTGLLLLYNSEDTVIDMFV